MMPKTFWTAYYTQKKRPEGAILSWRRVRDSNPRYAINVYSLSRGAPSATRPTLHNLWTPELLRFSSISVKGKKNKKNAFMQNIARTRAFTGTNLTHTFSFYPATCAFWVKKSERIYTPILTLIQPNNRNHQTPFQTAPRHHDSYRPPYEVLAQSRRPYRQGHHKRVQRQRGRIGHLRRREI